MADKVNETDSTNNSAQPSAGDVEQSSVPTGDDNFMTRFVHMMIYHRNAANLLMWLMIFFGLYGLSAVNRQFFPDIDLESVNVSIVWPGASAEDVDLNIVEPGQSVLRYLDGVEEFSATASDSNAQFMIEFSTGWDMSQAVSDVELAIARLTTLPADIEQPIIRRVVTYESVGSLLLYGDYPEKALVEQAKKIRDGLLQAGIDNVELFGVRDEEIWVETRTHALRRYGLAHQDIARAIADSSLDMPGGLLRGNVERQVRSSGLAKTAEAVGRIEVVTRQTGERVLVSDIARVFETFDIDQPTAWVGKKRAIEIRVKRSNTSDSLDMLDIMMVEVEKTRLSLPPGLSLDFYKLTAERIGQRLAMLTQNGLTGFVLVLLVLFLFLNFHVAIWVAVGIPITILIAIGLMVPAGQTLNMITMFAFIMMLGVIVDDAVVVGEHASMLYARGGLTPGEAAFQGANRMVRPILAAALTTLAAFIPIILIEGRFGQIVQPMVMVVVVILLGSLLECYFVLPRHMRHALSMPQKPVGGIRKAFLDRFENFRMGKFRIFTAYAFDNRYAIISMALATLLISIGLFVSGWLRFSFSPNPEGENIIADIRYHPGTPQTQTRQGMEIVQAALHQTDIKLRGDGPSLIFQNFAVLGEGRVGRGNNLASIRVELIPSETRDIRTADFIRAWQKNIPRLPGTRSVVVSSDGRLRGGFPIEFAFTGNDVQQLKNAAEALKEALLLYPGVIAPRDTLNYGRQELIMQVNEQGAALGFTNQNVGQQVRSAFEGAIARRFARDDTEVTVRVLLPRSQPLPSELSATNMEDMAADIATDMATDRAIDNRPADGKTDLSALPDTADMTNMTNTTNTTNTTDMADIVDIIDITDVSGIRGLEDFYLVIPASRPPRYIALPEVVSITEKPGFAAIRRAGGDREVAIQANFVTSAGSPDIVMRDVRQKILPDLLAKYNVQTVTARRDRERGHFFAGLLVSLGIALGLIYLILALTFSSYTRPFIMMSIIPFGLVGTLFGHFIQGYHLTFLSLIALMGLSGILINNSIILIISIEDFQARGMALRDAVINGACERLRPVVLTSVTTVLGLTPIMFETSTQAQWVIPIALTMAWGLATASLLVLFVVPAIIGIQEDIRLRRAGYAAQTDATGDKHYIADDTAMPGETPSS